MVFYCIHSNYHKHMCTMCEAIEMLPTLLREVVTENGNFSEQNQFSRNISSGVKIYENDIRTQLSRNTETSEHRCEFGCIEHMVTARPSPPQPTTTTKILWCGWFHICASCVFHSIVHTFGFAHSAKRSCAWLRNIAVPMEIAINKIYYLPKRIWWSVRCIFHQLPHSERDFHWK